MEFALSILVVIAALILFYVRDLVELQRDSLRQLVEIHKCCLDLNEGVDAVWRGIVEINHREAGKGEVPNFPMKNP